MQINYKHKAQVLATDLCKRINKLDKQTYLNSLEGIIKDQKLDDEYFDLVMTYDYKDIEEAKKILSMDLDAFQKEENPVNAD